MKAPGPENAPENTPEIIVSDAAREELSRLVQRKKAGRHVRVLITSYG